MIVSANDLLFGKLALARKLITQQDLLHCQRVQAIAERLFEKHFSLPEVMFFRELISPQQYASLLKQIEEEDVALGLKAPLFGLIVIEKGYATLEQILECLDIQRNEDLTGRRHCLLGEIMQKRGYLTENQLQEIAKLMKSEFAHGNRSRHI